MKSRHRSRPILMPTEERLKAAAKRRMSNRSASEYSLRQSLENYLWREIKKQPDTVDKDALHTELHQVIDRILVGYKKSGIINDASYAEMKTDSLRRRGNSTQIIVLKLGQKGLSAELIQKTLEDTKNGLNTFDVEILAAQALARRRRLGPFRKQPSSPKQIQKDLTAFARAGFSLAIAEKILGTSIEELVDETF